MNKQIWLQDGNTFSKGSATTVSYTNGIPRGIYEVRVSMAGFYLYKIADTFTFDYKLYGLNEHFINYVLKTYENTTGNLGVLLDGIKGTGKTVTAKELCNHLQLPVILVQSMGADNDDKLIKYLSTAIDFDCIFFFDEYEKEFKDSSVVLSFMDGVHNSIYRKIFLLTTNRLNVEPNLLGRPSRIRYKKSFGNLSEETTREILNDILEDKSAAEAIVELTHSMQIITIDLIKAIAAEINIHGIESFEDIKANFNIEFSSYTYGYKYVQYRKAGAFHFTTEEVEAIIKDYNKYKSMDSNPNKTNEERAFIADFYKKYYTDYDSCSKDKELQYLKIGDTFDGLRIVMIDPANKWIVTISNYGEVRINMITSCYSSSSHGGLNIIL